MSNRWIKKILNKYWSGKEMSPLNSVSLWQGPALNETFWESEGDGEETRCGPGPPGGLRQWQRLVAMSSGTSERILDGARLCRGDNEGSWGKGTKGRRRGFNWVMEDGRDVLKWCFSNGSVSTAVSLTVPVGDRSYSPPCPVDMEPEVKQLAPGHNARK
uniref:Uncharacterized protein n=1 Tax=Myotis myotis TaxID=51298 RepID=A0A7J7ZXC1_MYOMY|nr:hypothetical protein mMyoMyo1_009670 [Myotis myotis]